MTDARRAPAVGPARSEAVRRHNLGLLLGEVHRNGELSRAELTARSGLNRSTIGTLVGELVAAGLLRGEVPNAAARVEISAGRPSHRVGPRSDGPIVVAVDLDIDRIAVATVGIGGRVLARREADLPLDTSNSAEVIATIAATVRAAARSAPGPTVGVGISVPGSVCQTTGVVRLAPNLGWREVALVPALQAQLGAGGLSVPVAAGNDANLAAVAEHVRGHGRGVGDLVFLLGRVGVGAGIIAGGRLLGGHGGGAGEVGHLCLDAAGPACHCGSHGCAELFIGDTALLRAAGITANAGHRLVGHVLTAAAAGSPPELAAVRTVATYLGRTVAALLNVVDPATVITGGTLGQVLELAGAEVHAEVARFAFGVNASTLSLQATAFDAGEASLLGAAELAFEPLLRDPSAFACSARWVN